MELIQTNLSAEQEAQLRAFGEEEEPAQPAAPAEQAPGAGNGEQRLGCASVADSDPCYGCLCTGSHSRDT